MPARSAAARLWIAIEDRLIPALRLTTHERALYYHLLRRTRLVGRRAVRISRRKLAAVLGLSTYTARHYLRVLARKNCVRFLDRGSTGCLITVLLPEEIFADLSRSASLTCPACPACPESSRREWKRGKRNRRESSRGESNRRELLASLLHPPPIALDAAGQPRAWPRSDPFREKKFRERIFRRDRGRCFYCRRALGVPSIPSVAEGRRAVRSKTKGRPRDWTLDHVVPIALGGLDVVSNLVACCSPCNFEKALTPAEDFLRALQGRRVISHAELKARLKALRCLFLCKPPD